MHSDIGAVLKYLRGSTTSRPRRDSRSFAFDPSSTNLGVGEVGFRLAGPENFLRAKNRRKFAFYRPFSGPDRKRLLETASRFCHRRADRIRVDRYRKVVSGGPGRMRKIARNDPTPPVDDDFNAVLRPNGATYRKTLARRNVALNELFPNI
jgi:hypothetical protein